MGLKAAGAYVWALRETARIGRGALAKQLNTDDSQIERIEKGQIDTRASLLFAFIRAVRGNSAHVMTLILDESADEDSGRRLAKAQRPLTAADPVEQDERRRQLLALFDDLSATPRLLDQWLGYGACLREKLEVDQPGA